MRRSLFGTLLIGLCALALVASGSFSRGYAQTVAPSGDEFNGSGFTAPFVARCSANAFPTPCPDPQSATTWSLNGVQPGYLRIMTQPGSLLASTNNARNLILQPYSTTVDWTVSTRLVFPGTTTAPTALGQTAGLIAYQDDDNFIFVGRVFDPTTNASQLEFVQEVGGVDVVTRATEGGLFSPQIFLRLQKVGNTYFGSYSYDNATFVPLAAALASNVTPTATATGTPTGTPVPTGYTAAFTSPQVGLFAFGGTDTRVGSFMLPADFDWFRVGNSLTPAATATATSTATTTATVTPTATGTPAPTATATATAIPAATSTPTAAPTATTPPVPTPTPRPPAPKAAFKYTSIWYHVVRIGTFNHIEVQGTRSTTYGIWVHVYFPSGVHFQWYENTDNRGHWVKEFPIPRNSLSRYSPWAVVTFQLWKGRANAKSHDRFSVVR